MYICSYNMWCGGSIGGTDYVRASTCVLLYSCARVYVSVEHARCVKQQSSLVFSPRTPFLCSTRPRQSSRLRRWTTMEPTVSSWEHC